MTRNLVDPTLVRAAGDRRLERRRAATDSLAEEFAASERDFEAMVAVSAEPNLFDRAVTWLRSLGLPTDLFVVAPVALRGDVAVRKFSEDASGAASLAADTNSKVEIAFENHHSEPVWVVACEQNTDGSVSFVPEKDLSEAPCVDPGDALTFTFTPTSETVMRVLAIALRTQPSGDAAEILAEPTRLQEFGVVATARFVLRVSPPAK